MWKTYFSDIDTVNFWVNYAEANQDIDYLKTLEDIDETNFWSNEFEWNLTQDHSTHWEPIEAYKKKSVTFEILSLDEYIASI